LKDKSGKPEGWSEWEPIKILFMNSAYEPDFIHAPPQACFAKPTQPLKCYWTKEQDPNNNHMKHAAGTHTTRLLAPKTGQAGF
jgi:hypothetical protein